MAKVVCISEHRRKCEHCGGRKAGRPAKPEEIYVCTACERAIREKLKRGEGVTLRAM